VFTEQDVAMLSSVLNTERAVKVNVAIMRVLFDCEKFSGPPTLSQAVWIN